MLELVDQLGGADGGRGWGRSVASRDDLCSQPAHKVLGTTTAIAR